MRWLFRIISLAGTLRLGVVAEGVETAGQLACLPELAFAALGTAASALVTGHR
jgi:EAL domain-containing protein (putative c-di-GMP-specific phosphodiesterase class I)